MSDRCTSCGKGDLVLVRGHDDVQQCTECGVRIVDGERMARFFAHREGRFIQLHAEQVREHGVFRIDPSSARLLIDMLESLL